MKKINFLSLFTALLLFACSDNPTVPEQNISFMKGAWEVPVGSGTSLDYYYRLNLQHNGNELSGSFKMPDVQAAHTGMITGEVSGNSVSFSANGPDNTHDFTFRGTYSQSTSDVTGYLKFVSLTDGQDSIPVTVNSTTTDSCAIDSTLNPNNAYIFQKVWSAPSPSAPPVIFVHGMAATLNEWDTLIMQLGSNFKSQHDIYCFQYNWVNAISANGQALLDSVTIAGLTDPILVGHSMGGLVSRAYISAGGNITKLVTLGTPHLGTPLAGYSSLFCWLGEPGPADMKPDSDFITGLLNNPNDISNRSKYYVIAGQVGGHFSGLKWVWNEDYYSSFIEDAYYVLKLYFDDNDGLVPENSSLFESAGNVNRPLAVQQWIDHMHLANPNYAQSIFDYINGL